MGTANEFPFAFGGSEERWSHLICTRLLELPLTFWGSSSSLPSATTAETFLNKIPFNLLDLVSILSNLKAQTLPQTSRWNTEANEQRRTSRFTWTSIWRWAVVLAGTELVWLLGLDHTSLSRSWGAQEEEEATQEIWGSEGPPITQMDTRCCKKFHR